MDATTCQDQEVFEDDTEGPESGDRDTVADDEASPLPPDVDPVDPAEQGEDPEEMGLSESARFARWQSRRPRVDHLKDGLARVPGRDGAPATVVPLFDVGDRIVIDRRTRLLNGFPWLETIVGPVRSIDDDTGVITVYDESTDPRHMAVRYVSVNDELHVFKLAPKRGNPFTVTAIRQAAKPEPQPGDPTKRGRGRPKGAKNRPKEVIQAEREAYRKMMDEKKAKRKGK